MLKSVLHSRRQDPKTPVNKLSCADWLPHDRGFVSGLPQSKRRASAGGPAHNSPGGFPTAVLSPAMHTLYC